MIHIKKNDYYVFESDELSPRNLEFCEFCGSQISNVYVEIIRKLKENGLLDKSFKMRCCNCYFSLRMVEDYKCNRCNNAFFVLVDHDYLEIYCVKCGITYHP